MTGSEKPSDKVIALAAGRDHSLVLRESSGLLGWGGDGTGRFPLPAGVCSAPTAEGGAVHISGNAPLRQIAASAGLSLALDANGTAYVWGANRAGLGGKLSSITQSQPRALNGLPTLSQISSSEFFSLARARDGNLYHWGLIPGAEQTRNTSPQRISPAPLATACCAGGSHVLILDRAHNLWAWGANTAGQLGLGHLQDQITPIRLSHKRKMMAVTAGASHSLAIDVKHQVWAWGSNQHGQLGDLSEPYRTEPAKVALPEPVLQVAAGLYVSYALGRSGQLYAWGWNAKGQLGQGNTSAVAGVQQISQLPPLKLLAAGQGHILVSDGFKVWTWGDNPNGQLGDAKAYAATPLVLSDSALKTTNSKELPT